MASRSINWSGDVYCYSYDARPEKMLKTLAVSGLKEKALK